MLSSFQVVRGEKTETPGAQEATANVLFVTGQWGDLSSWLSGTEGYLRMRTLQCLKLGKSKKNGTMSPYRE